MALQVPVPDAIVRRASKKAEQIGKIALKRCKTAKEAADFVNDGSWKGFGANHTDAKPKLDEPEDWTGQAEDKRWLTIHNHNDSRPKP